MAEIPFEPYTGQGKLRFWCQKVLPLVYDESLSYYELLNKVVDYLNNTIDDVSACEDNITALRDAFVQLQDYVNEQLEDFAPEVERIIDEMVDSGEFGEILTDVVNGLIAGEYSTTQGYVQFDYVLKDGKLYCATASTSGEWDSTKWRETTVGADMQLLNQRVYNLNAGQVAFNESVAYDNNTVGKKLKDLDDFDDNLNAGQVTYNSENTYNNATVGKELQELKGSLNDINDSLISWISGKKISIIGDSIDTFNQTGYKIDGYTMFYPNSNIPDITDVNQTWWKRVIDASGATLEINASYSGSYVTKQSSAIPSLYERVNVIGSPDAIIVSLGTNDAYNAVAMGSFDFTTQYTSLSDTEFRPAYIKGIKALQATHPNAKIICIAKKMSYSYIDAIKAIAEKLNCYFVDCREYTGEYNIHPGEKGMREIASKVFHPVNTMVDLSICENTEPDSTASHTYSAGYFLYHNNKLYKALTAIAAGDTLTEGSNITPANITDELYLHLPYNITKGLNIKRKQVAGANSFTLYFPYLLGAGNRACIFILGTANTQTPMCAIIGARPTYSPEVVNLNTDRPFGATFDDSTQTLTVTLPAISYDNFIIISNSDVS